MSTSPDFPFYFSLIVRCMALFSCSSNETSLSESLFQRDSYGVRIVWLSVFAKKLYERKIKLLFKNRDTISKFLEEDSIEKSYRKASSVTLSRGRALDSQTAGLGLFWMRFSVFLSRFYVLANSICAIRFLIIFAKRQRALWVKSGALCYHVLAKWLCTKFTQTCILRSRSVKCSYLFLLFRTLRYASLPQPILASCIVRNLVFLMFCRPLLDFYLLFYLLLLLLLLLL